MVEVPKHRELFWPTLKAMKDLGGSASIQELMDQIITNENYSEDIQNVGHHSDPRGKLGYNAAWARTYLKKYGAINNSARGLWVLTEKGEHLSFPETEEIDNWVKKQNTNINNNNKKNTSAEESLDETMEEAWKSELLQTLKDMSPDAFERLSKRILRESGFIKVEVTGKTGDGGIDGIGILRVNLISFHVSFQCKRYTGTVGARDLRDFRGAMIGRGDKGLFITTGSFTKAAQDEANRDGAPPIDLIDGDYLCDLLKDLELGVNLIQKIEIDQNWFSEI